MSEFPAGWAEAPLGAVLLSSVGGMWGSANPGDGCVLVRVVRGAEFRDWQAVRGQSAPRRFIPASAFEARQLQIGDVVLEVSGGGPTQPVGRTVLIDEQALSSTDAPLVCSNFCRRLVLSREMDPRFVWYQLQNGYAQNATDQFQRATTNIRNLQVPHYLAGTPLRIAPRAEQERIVAAVDEQFSRLDAGVAALQQAEVRLERIATATLMALIDSNGWPTETLSSLCAPARPIVYGIIKPGPDHPSGVPYVRVTEMKTGKIDPGSLRRADPERERMFARARLKENDILVSKDGTIGKVAIVPPSVDGANITQHVVRVSLRSGMNVNYVALAIRAPYVQHQLTQETRGVALRGVNVGDFRNLRIPMPDPLQQSTCVDTYRRYESLFESTAQQILAALDRAARLRCAILAAAFSGKLVPQDPSDESAVVLAARVAAESASSSGHKVIRRRTGRSVQAKVYT